MDVQRYGIDFITPLVSKVVGKVVFQRDGSSTLVFKCSYFATEIPLKYKTLLKSNACLKY